MGKQGQTRGKSDHQHNNDRLIERKETSTIETARSDAARISALIRSEMAEARKNRSCVISIHKE